MRFTGLRPLTGHSQLDVHLDGLGEVDLRNQASIVGIRFVPGRQHFSVFVDFRLTATDTQVSLEFTDAEIIRLQPIPPTTVDPRYSHDLLRELLYWKTHDTGREGCSVSTTILEFDLHTPEVKAHITQP